LPPRSTTQGNSEGVINELFFTDPLDRLVDSSATVIGAGVTTPDLAELMTYDAVPVLINLDLADSGTLCDNWRPASTPLTGSSWGYSPI